MANEIYQVIGTPVSFSDGGDVQFAPASTVFANGHQSDEWDRGASPQPDEYDWRAKVKVDAGGTVGETIDFYMATSNATGVTGIVDGTVTPGNGPLAAAEIDHLANMLYIGSLVLDNVGTDSIQSSGVFRMSQRFGTLVMWNSTVGQTLSAVGADHEFIATPIYYQGQV